MTKFDSLREVLLSGFFRHSCATKDFHDRLPVAVAGLIIDIAQAIVDIGC